MNNAIEILTTYGWAVLVVIVAIGLLAYFGVLTPDKILPDSCTCDIAGFDDGGLLDDIDGIDYFRCYNITKILNIELMTIDYFRTNYLLKCINRSLVMVN